MAKNKNNQAIWNTRIKKQSSLFQKIGNSIDIDKRLYKEDIAGSIAHVEMLFKQKIISFKIKNKIIYGLNKIEKEILKNKFEFNKKYEDIHMNIEKRLFQIIGDEAGYVHTARSRNDQVITDLKMWMKSATKEINKQIDKILKSTLKVAEKNIETIMPGFTHLKNAQPISFAHYLMAYVEMFSRDKKRFFNNLESLNENPLGVAALTGTSFNIDRYYTTKKLGFKTPTNNSVDTVSDRDFVVDFLYSVSVCSMHISRVAEELIIWNSDGFNIIKLSDKVVTGSSIMPQKKNPDLLEYLRGKSGITYGNLFSMLTILKGLPLSYFKDLQDDKEIIFKSYDTIINCLKIFDEILKNFSPNKNKMLELANNGYITATDLADYLVKNHTMSFREAYQKTAAIVNLAEKRNKKLEELDINELKKIEPKLTNEVLKIFDLKNSINSKKSYGGTAFDNIKKMILKYKKQL
ncbi:MAG: argininosuccinate lyase [Pelagibacteraceae bacterium BACL5 MAG-120820-bin39]|jgi:argininosuccinate lyase|uniref:argininosuccinate lyase n=1 Tax=Candidatus Pelagibacter sp. TaxID=2024849 RepID=UPI00071298A2|nr:MAG: argininosuccinate lyase [Pelagibacteraceae bacterium BACL5 MAG-121015-bin10]KRO65006.1 MAG: argininosuccinate lyase [Pelagibacteraceae bacterium BACL5 MAG-120820-bin39]MDA1166669.1 argininosuccinate lyase [Pseudomonadota bacterium]